MYKLMNECATSIVYAFPLCVQEHEPTNPEDLVQEDDDPNNAGVEADIMLRRQPRQSTFQKCARKRLLGRGHLQASSLRGVMYAEISTLSRGASWHNAQEFTPIKIGKNCVISSALETARATFGTRRQNDTLQNCPSI